MRWLPLALILACGFTDQDLDQDGVTVADGDCDDLAPATFPGATEVPYDGIDQDCDGTDLQDQDGDGHGATVVGGDDCDDADPQTLPGAWERFGDGKDQDCDGVDASWEGPWSQVSLGSGFACGLHADSGRVSCWGLRSHGGLRLAPLGSWSEVSAGGTHACVTSELGEVRCWGELPAEQSGLHGVDAGLSRTCGLDDGQDLRCWGAGFTELVGPFEEVSLADRLSGLALWTCTTNAISLRCVDQRGADAPARLNVFGQWQRPVIGGGFVCALDIDGFPSCWDLADPPPDVALQSLSAGQDHACGLDLAGRLHCWGDIAEPPGGRFAGLTGSGDTHCAWTQAGQVDCWGAPLADVN